MSMVTSVPYANIKPIFHCAAKTFALDPSLAKTPNVKFRVGNTNMLVSKNVKICVTPAQILKFGLPPTQNSNASQWNIGCIGSQTQHFRVGHVHFFFFVSISFVLGPAFQWNTGLRNTKEAV